MFIEAVKAQVRAGRFVKKKKKKKNSPINVASTEQNGVFVEGSHLALPGLNFWLLDKEGE